MEANAYFIWVKMNKNINKSIGWIDGEWGSTDALTIPINDRGLTLGDGVFETIAISNGRPKLIIDHLKRFKKGAALLGMATPPSHAEIFPLIQEGIDRLSLHKSNGSIRLNWSRGSSNQRGINIDSNDNKESNHRFWLEIHASEPIFNSVSAIISQCEKRNPNSQLSHCKSFNYGQAIQAKREAQLAGVEEAILLSVNGQVSCGSASNIFILREKKWLTPSSKSGCLNGVMRQQALKVGILNEAEISPKPEEEDQWILINSLSCRPIKTLNGDTLSTYTKCKELWEILSN
mgnify:CR=1 FL=1